MCRPMGYLRPHMRITDRSTAMSPTVSLRADLPFYDLKHSKRSSSGEYMVPLSLNFGFAFR